MHDLTFDEKNRGFGRYMCAKDRYDAKFNLIDNDNFTLNYVVKTQAPLSKRFKDYTTDSSFRRASKKPAL